MIAHRNVQFTELFWLTSTVLLNGILRGLLRPEATLNGSSPDASDTGGFGRVEVESSAYVAEYAIDILRECTTTQHLASPKLVVRDGGGCG